MCLEAVSRNCSEFLWVMVPLGANAASLLGKLLEPVYSLDFCPSSALDAGPLTCNHLILYGCIMVDNVMMTDACITL